jgi:hypothetical protein
MKPTSLLLDVGIVGVATAVHFQAEAFRPLTDRHNVSGFETSFGNVDLLQSYSVLPYQPALSAQQRTTFINTCDRNQGLKISVKLACGDVSSDFQKRDFLEIADAHFRLSHWTTKSGALMGSDVRMLGRC